MATQERWFAQTEKISWEHRDPSNASFRMTFKYFRDAKLGTRSVGRRCRLDRWFVAKHSG